MFKNDKYITCGIEEKVPTVIQLILWNLIDELGKTQKLDYLQVFELSPVTQDHQTVQQVIHSQEVPPYKETHYLTGSEPFSAKIFVIDDKTHCTMLLAQEY